MSAIAGVLERGCQTVQCKPRASWRKRRIAEAAAPSPASVVGVAITNLFARMLVAGALFELGLDARLLHLVTR